VRAITIRNPWTQAILAGAKTVENRGNYTSHRGLIAIHAANLDADSDARIIDLLGGDASDRGVYGAVVAVARLTGCHRADIVGLAGVCCQSWGARWHHGRDGVGPAYHLVLADVVVLPEPVPARGQQAVPWTLPRHVETAVVAQFALAAVAS
jgi:hypothetical protein